MFLPLFLPQFLPQFLPRDADRVAVPLLALGAAYIGVEFCCACGYAALGSRLQRMGSPGAPAGGWTR
ncbi:hypothetical protein [Streptomyces sp. NBC_01373]|uniref:hypothetical protein n=1 Tax=Streptomyces sp. NBC_01373 TaxID=2903843 RepID=UPI00224D7F71|nr:hypothetical protein [Streptomyces sp. NBC_01373]MCX4698811.1 hypothetical protein [Streptomyces sp. NBC_01373]